MYHYMLDTNICIYTIKRRPAEVKEKFTQHLGRFCISSVVASELWYGAAKSGIARHRQDLESLLARIPVLEFDEKSAEKTGYIRADLANRGMPIGPYDVQIASHALTLGLTLVSNNLKEFQRIPDLNCENWIN